MARTPSGPLLARSEYPARLLPNLKENGVY